VIVIDWVIEIRSDLLRKGGQWYQKPGKKNEVLHHSLLSEERQKGLRAQLISFRLLMLTLLQYVRYLQSLFTCDLMSSLIGSPGSDLSPGSCAIVSLDIFPLVRHVALQYSARLNLAGPAHSRSSAIRRAKLVSEMFEFRTT
jgi:hypothetical protein